MGSLKNCANKINLRKCLPVGKMEKPLNLLAQCCGSTRRETLAQIREVLQCSRVRVKPLVNRGLMFFVLGDS